MPKEGEGGRRPITCIWTLLLCEFERLGFSKGVGGRGVGGGGVVGHVLIKHSDLSNFTYFFPVYRTIVGPIVAVIALIISCTIGCVCYRKYNVKFLLIIVFALNCPYGIEGENITCY